METRREPSWFAWRKRSEWFAKLMYSIVLALNPASISKYARNPRLRLKSETDLRNKEL
jgi:hypothetical protein